MSADAEERYWQGQHDTHGPGALPKNCSSPTGRFVRRVKSGVDIGPFKVSGLDFAVESLRQLFAEVEHQHPLVFKEVKTEGMLCVRHRRSNPARFSNHSWGAAIDLFSGDPSSRRAPTSPIVASSCSCRFSTVTGGIGAASSAEIRSTPCTSSSRRRRS